MKFRIVLLTFFFFQTFCYDIGDLENEFKEFQALALSRIAELEHEIMKKETSVCRSIKVILNNKAKTHQPDKEGIYEAYKMVNGKMSWKSTTTGNQDRKK